MGLFYGIKNTQANTPLDVIGLTDTISLEICQKKELYKKIKYLQRGLKCNADIKLVNVNHDDHSQNMQ